MWRSHGSRRREEHRCTIPKVDNDQTSTVNAEAGMMLRSANQVNKINEYTNVDNEQISGMEINQVGSQLPRQGWGPHDHQPFKNEAASLQWGKAYRFTRDDRLISEAQLETETEVREPFFCTACRLLLSKRSMESSS